MHGCESVGLHVSRTAVPAVLVSSRHVLLQPLLFAKDDVTYRASRFSAVHRTVAVVRGKSFENAKANRALLSLGPPITCNEVIEETSASRNHA